MYVGVDYYPEHWPRERWATDARLMKEAGFNVVRLAEFAWIDMEPEEDRFEFGWLDEALATLADAGINALICTPTAAMPAWVQRKYPEVMAMQSNGQRITWGVRKNNCFTSGAYRLLSERITRAMAEHFKDTPNIIGWQTDNELNEPLCYCNSCRAGFQDWLRSRYGTLDELNRAWGTHFWGHKFTTWGEIILPDDFTSHNPGLCLDWRRYNSWLNVQFQHDQVKIMREVCPQHFITHNFMGTWATAIDYYDLAEDLDFVSWDNYPLHGEPEMLYHAAMAADLMRGCKAKNFWIMEQTAGNCGWGEFTRCPRPGEIRRICYQQLSHGADAQVWFRWRTCTAGREQYWHGLLQHDGEPRRRYQEAAEVASEYHKLAPELEGTTVPSQVAIVYDYDSVWATQIQPGFHHNTHQERVARYYNALLRAGINVDMVKSTSDLTKYKAVLTPNLYVLPDAIAKSLEDYVKAGGVLLADCRLGVKDETSLCYDRTLPGLLSDCLGISIEEYDALPDGMQYPITGTEDLPGSFTAIQYCDWITAQEAKTLAGYAQWHMQDFAAVTCNDFYSGKAFYVGAIVNEPAFYDAVIGKVLEAAGIEAIVTPPEGVEASVRTGDGKTLVFIVNHTEQEKTVTVPAGKVELLSGDITGDSLVLERFGVAVIKM